MLSDSVAHAFPSGARADLRRADAQRVREPVLHQLLCGHLHDAKHMRAGEGLVLRGDPHFRHVRVEHLVLLDRNGLRRLRLAAMLEHRCRPSARDSPH